MLNWIRNFRGTIIAFAGLILLTIITFGDMGELFTEQYWVNVGGNLTSIGALTVGLMFIQITIKQGISEQALSKGLNTDITKTKYTEHKDIIKKNTPKRPYLPAFLAVKNKLDTKRRRVEFLIDNSFPTEKSLLESHNKRLIKIYKHIKTHMTPDSITWSTVKIVYTKEGTIEKLESFRRKRLIKAVSSGIISMLGTTLITSGLFLANNNIPLWQRFIQLLTYMLTIAITVIPSISTNYEKGAHGVPNELDDINSVWEEFTKWEVPAWVITEIKEAEESMEKKEGVVDEKSKKTFNTPTGLQEKPEEIKVVQVLSSNNILVTDGPKYPVPCICN